MAKLVQFATKRSPLSHFLVKTAHFLNHWYSCTAKRRGDPRNYTRAQRALYEDQWQNLCSLRRRSSVPLPGEDKLFRKLLPSELPSRAYIVLLPGADHVAGLFSDTTERALVKPLLLSPRGIVTDGPPTPKKNIQLVQTDSMCTSCFTSLKVAQNATPLQLAIANGLVL